MTPEQQSYRTNSGTVARDPGQVFPPRPGQPFGQPQMQPQMQPQRRPGQVPVRGRVMQRQPSTPSAPVSRVLQVAFAAAVILLLSGCIAGFTLAAVPSDSAAATDANVAAGGVSTLALPFATGTSISISQGPHADNYGSVQGSVVYRFTGQATVPASIDLAANQGVAVKPVSAGRVLAAWPVCNVVVVDQGGGVWAEYVHVQVAVSSGQSVSRDTTLGYVLGAYDHSNTSCGDHSSGPHLHLAFINGSGTSGSYVPIAGRVLCGHTVDSAGDLVGLGTVNGGSFLVPGCDATSQSPAQDPSTPTPTSAAPNTDAPVAQPPAAQQPAGSCATPTLQSPGAGASFPSTQDVWLSWSGNCAQFSAELTGAPYGTLSFGGWQSGQSVHIGTMWPGTYTWHVNGRSASGQETGWSASATFTIGSSSGSASEPPAPVVSEPPAPVVSDPPAPVVSDPPAPVVSEPPAPVVSEPPAPVVTNSPTPCPFKDGGTGVTFYSGANFTGQSWTWYVPAGNGDAYADLPSALFRNLGSFYVSNNAWHVVLYQGENGTGNLGHYDGSWANVDSYWHNTESVKIDINRTC
jgi:murein DD-endopeptidase MepM/ murein hydrolase activator NlpD